MSQGQQQQQQGQQTTKQPAQPTDTTDFEKLTSGPVTRRESLKGDACAFLGIHPDKVYNVLRGIWTVTKGQDPLSDSEIWVGLALVARYELDPFAREIYVTRSKDNRPMVILGLDGWIRVLDRTDHYDGFEQELVMDDGGKITEVTTTIHSKKRSHPAKYRAFATEYAQLAGFMHKKIPGHMLRIFSLKHAARLFVPLGGVVTQEEADWMAPADNGSPPESSPEDLRKRLEEATAEATKPAPKSEPDPIPKKPRKPEPEEAEAIAEPEPPYNPPTPAEVADAEKEADRDDARARRFDEYVELFAQADASTVARLSTQIDGDLQNDKLTRAQWHALCQEITKAKERLS